MIQFLGEKKKLEEFSWYYRVGTTVFTSIMKKIVFVATCNIYNQIVIILFAIFDQFYYRNWLKLDKFGFIKEHMSRFACSATNYYKTWRKEKKRMLRWEIRRRANIFYNHRIRRFFFIRKILLYKITRRRKIYLCVYYTRDITYFNNLVEISLI